MLSAVASARRAPSTCECGAPVPWGSHFCANCGRPVGGEPVVACQDCGHPLPADAKFCANCGRQADTAEEAESAPQADEPAPEEEGEVAVGAAADEPQRGNDPWEN